MHISKQMKTTCMVLLATALLVAGGCDSGRNITADTGVSDGTSPDGSTADQGKSDIPPQRVPKKHRPTRDSCDNVRDVPEPTPLPGSGGDCTAHADCTKGDNGRCVMRRFGPTCDYDQCFADADCGAASVCKCGDGGAANVCLASKCEIDADCGASGYCSPSFGDCGNYSGVIGFFCHTPADECVDDEDCAGGPPGSFGAPYCAYNKAAGHWKCSNSHCAG